jgi:hypothetical protein
MVASIASNALICSCPSGYTKVITPPPFGEMLAKNEMIMSAIVWFIMRIDHKCANNTLFNNISRLVQQEPSNMCKRIC